MGVKQNLQKAAMLGGVNIGNVTLVRAALPMEYTNLLEHNPILAQVEGNCRTGGQWTDLEIRTAQLILAVAATAELQRHLQELNFIHKVV